MSASGKQLVVISAEEYILIAERAGRQIYWSTQVWRCDNCGGNTGRKRSDCPACKGNGGEAFTTPYVPKEDGARVMRDQVWREMAELLRSGRIFYR